MIFLSVVLFISIILFINLIFINFLNVDLFFYFNKNIILGGFLILSIIYIFYFITIDVDLELSNKKQKKITENMDFLIIIIFLLSIVFWAFYWRFIDNNLFLKIFINRHNLSLSWLITSDNIRLLLSWIKYFVLFISLWSSIFLLWLLDRLFYPKNIYNFILNVFSFNIKHIWNEVKQEDKKDSKFFIKSIILNIIKIIVFLYNKIKYFVSKLINKKFNLEIWHQVVDEQWNVISYWNDKDYIHWTQLQQNENILSPQSFNQSEDIQTWEMLPNDRKEQNWSNDSDQHSISNTEGQILQSNITNEDLNIPHQDIVMWNLTDPHNPEVIQQTRELNEQLAQENNW